MRRFILFLVCLPFISSSVNAQTLTDEGVLSKDTIVYCENAIQTEIYNRVMQSLSDLKGANSKSTTNLDFSDKESGIINYKGKLYSGFYKFSTGYGFDCYANTSIKIRIKDGRYKLAVEVESMTFHWAANNFEDETIPIADCYPQLRKGYKPHMKVKKACAYIAPFTDDAINEIINEIAKKSTITVSDDF